MEELKKMAGQVDAYNRSTMVQMKAPKIRDKTPNSIQITAEQIIADPEIHKLDTITMPLQHLIGQDEVNGYKDKKRKEFEDQLRRQRFHLGLWIRYAEWEGMLQEYRRARSIFERALDVTPYTPSLWLRYAEFEMKHKFLNHARNVFERATTILPRVDQFWYKYIYMEEVLANYDRAREVFEKWMGWNPVAEAWLAAVSFETRVGEPERARKVLFRFLEENPKVENYVRVGKWEESGRRYQSAREVCERALREIGEEALTEEFFLFWTRLELRMKDYVRTEQLFEFAFGRLKGEHSAKLRLEFAKFQAKHGKEKDVVKTVLAKRRPKYREKVDRDPRDYDGWFALAQLEEEAEDWREAQRVLVEGQGHLPERLDKASWKRYVWLFRAQAILEETQLGDKTAAVATLERCLKVIPHKMFTFGKVWIETAKIHLRIGDLKATRMFLGRAIGVTGASAVYAFYIDLESRLGNFDRCRTLHEKRIEADPSQSVNWISYCDMEAGIGEVDRARSVITKSLEVGLVDQPEHLWKAAIDLEVEHGQPRDVLKLYNSLLEKSRHVKVYLSLGLYCVSQEMVGRMREVFGEADALFKVERMNEERAAIINNWFECEVQLGDQVWVEKVRQKLPKKIKKQRVVPGPAGSFVGDLQYEEYVDYVFNDEGTKAGVSGLQRLAQNWKGKTAQIPQSELQK